MNKRTLDEVLNRITGVAEKLATAATPRTRLERAKALERQYRKESTAFKHRQCAERIEAVVESAIKHSAQEAPESIDAIWLRFARAAIATDAGPEEALRFANQATPSEKTAKEFEAVIEQYGQDLGARASATCEDGLEGLSRCTAAANTAKKGIVCAQAHSRALIAIGDEIDKTLPAIEAHACPRERIAMMAAAAATAFTPEQWPAQWDAKQWIGTKEAIDEDAMIRLWQKLDAEIREHGDADGAGEKACRALENAHEERNDPCARAIIAALNPKVALGGEKHQTHTQ